MNHWLEEDKKNKTKHKEDYKKNIKAWRYKVILWKSLKNLSAKKPI